MMIGRVPSSTSWQSMGRECRSRKPMRYLTLSTMGHYSRSCGSTRSAKMLLTGITEAPSTMHFRCTLLVTWSVLDWSQQAESRVTQMHWKWRSKCWMRSRKQMWSQSKKYRRRSQPLDLHLQRSKSQSQSQLQQVWVKQTGKSRKILSVPSQNQWKT